MAEPADRVSRRRVPNTKIAVPNLPAHLVSRPRLLAALDKAGDVAVTSVCAPAGAGKTLLLAEWAHRRHRGAVCWVSLDADDNDDRRLWSAILDALENHPAVGPLSGVEVPAEPGADPAFLALVAEAFGAAREPVVLVLDGIQEIVEPVVRNGLQALLRHRPARLRLILSGRLDPPLSLARLRLADQLAEVRAEQLRFTEAEAAALFAFAGADAAPETLTRLVTETDGWAVGLRLAADAVTGDRLDGLLAGHDRALQQYLADEVLAPLEQDLREFLFAISVCPVISADPARALSGRPDAAAALHELRERIMVLAPASSGEYRLSPLLRAYLLADLGRRDPDRLAALHATAADWFAGNADPAAALGHAVRAGDSTRLASLLAGHAIRLFLAGQHRALRHALGALDDPVLAEDPLLTLVLAALHLELAETGTAGLYLARAESVVASDSAPEVEILRQLVRARRAEIGAQPTEIARAAEAIDVKSARRTELGLLAAVQSACATMAPADRAPLEAALAEAESLGQHHVVTRCRTALGRITGNVGDYLAMHAYAREAGARTKDAGRTVEGTAGAVLLAYSALLRADPAEAVRQAADAGRFAERRPPPVEAMLPVMAGVLRGAAEFELGDWYAGLRRMGQARLGGAGLPGDGRALCAVLEQRAAVLLGAGERAREVLRWSQRVRVCPGELALMRARAQFALGRHSLAAHLLDLLLDGAAPTAVPWSRIEGMLLGVQIALATGERDHAHRWLARALTAGEEADVWFPLVFAPADVVEALTSLLGTLGGRERFAARVLDRRRRLNRPSIPTPLTERERSVLRLLPTLRSIEEIAEDLTVSPNTVKTHVRGIYAKLSVRRRRDAVAAAIRQGLLEPRDDFPD
ncbi:LuxR C-terminal-related transcriptional regulator [Amycolatopsis sp.]|uniref:LuxR C-terminal-related transcriptional regulator n=1 Tax=Amycolatopsis sp. TaxID=37632 RepID=UPI002CBA76AF|nr:LuxR C-terminal-related transcriptional regulator [Amycolatopsis sp.]HVV14539.1 LuxR C-terminal-related transcriptional regulator [Amycolatopsis sp.]